MHTLSETRPDAVPGDGQPPSAVDDARPESRFAVPGFDAVARLAAQALHVPLVALVLSDGRAYWYTAGADDPTRPSDILAIAYLEAARSHTAEVVLDTGDDARFRPAPPVPHPASAPVRFFASEPVRTLTGQQVGALCVMDHAPRSALAEHERVALRDAAALAGAGVVLRGYLGRTDPVTQLPHRSAFFEDLRTHLRDDTNHAWLVAIEVASVARFNAFVRAMGHAYADELMRVVAARVQQWMTPDMHLYQVSVTRLAIVLPQTHGEPTPARLDELVARLRHPFDCLNIPLTLRPGIGLLQVDARELRGGDPLRRVMSASHAAQRSAPGWARYEQTQDEHHRQQFFLVTELAAAITERAELDLHYQPRIDLDSGRCVALEALLRWHHPTLGEVQPGEFIGLAEQAGLMRALTEWVFDHGMAQLATWRADGLDIRLSLNVSSADFDAELVARLQVLMSRHGIDPHLLELEFTESTLMQHCDATRRHLAAICALGTTVAIDDFGIGYSNLASLRQMPASSLKIDQSLVRGIDKSHADAAIVRSVSALARDLGFRVVVEGVESESVHNVVLAMACDEVQGFHISRPLPARDVPGWLRSYAAAPLPPRHRSPS
ncbi:EAL domain-containing protein [Rhodanobacter glycinis]|uniref:EAL domain-containing protein n=1 Tax=Rhodanobacter glycinis TaxID=582702 RepID=A0A5B9E7P9_9GAMM|nr:GGDEF domain-containing phosphodiesterase [Rhodanobacter glycinis]QEE26106.1 EAL domain-containing protein [Rhodanobacter glycinis]